MVRSPQRTLAAIEDFIAREGYSPSYREIAEEAGGISVSTVHCHIRVLETMGCIVRNGSRSHTIKVVKPWTR